MSGPLAGVRIIEFARICPGPFCGMMLADHGAEVIRIDRLGARGLVSARDKELARQIQRRWRLAWTASRRWSRSLATARKTSPTCANGDHGVTPGPTLRTDLEEI
jgi:alpha-methylacyl-CoA racemase